MTDDARRNAEIRMATSAFEAVQGEKSYLTMPVTSGKQLYRLLEKYKLRSKEELIRRQPQALYGEVITPNVDRARSLAERIQRERHTSLVVPGLFEAYDLQWSREDYMNLWLPLITNSVRELYLAEGYAYTTGGAQEAVRAMLIQFRFIRRDAPISMFDHELRPVGLSHIADDLVSAIRDLSDRGFDVSGLQQCLSEVVEIVRALRTMYEENEPQWHYHVANAASFSSEHIRHIAHWTGKVVPHWPAYAPDWRERYIAETHNYAR